ncbi:MAG: permease [Candidatus Margulisbacteria bacterium]|nr:permease [Candidatus Margulisiibacteriota bacterium]
MPHCHHPKRAWFKDPLFLISTSGITVLFSIHIMIPGSHLWHHFTQYLQLIWVAVLLGMVVGGIIDYFIPNIYIEHLLAGNRKKTIFHAVGLGFLMSACSHGILAIAIQLYKKGASIPSVIAFLMASPWANFPLTILLIGLFGWKALVIIGSAIVVALITGFIFQQLDARNLLDSQQSKSIPLDPSFSVYSDIQSRLQKTHLSLEWVKQSVLGILSGMWSLSKMVLWWILIGIIVASVVRTVIPPGWLMEYLGPTPLGLLLTLCLATVIEVCSEGTAPLALELYQSTHAFGGVFLFLMAGVATDYTEIGLLWRNAGKRTAILLPLITVPQIFLIGLLLNLIYFP